MRPLEWISVILSCLFGLCFLYQVFYTLVGFFCCPKPLPPAKKQRRFAVLVAARNEESVIGSLMEAIKNQTYPADLIRVLVVADNCTDRTAEVAREAGATVVERRNLAKVGKGYALAYLFDRIAELEGGFGGFDAYAVFDADNLPEPGFFDAMNRGLDTGKRILTGYRNATNYGDNWLSAGYGLAFLREARFLNHPRQLLGQCCGVTGTGFVMSREIVEKNRGWHWFLLTEDGEFTMDSLLAGERVGYCHEARFYDEQPVDWQVSVRQRLRWAKGSLQVFLKYHRELFRRFCKTGDFACYDLFMTGYFAAVLPLFTSLLSLILLVVAVLLRQQEAEELAFWLVGQVGGSYFGMFFAGAATLFTEWRRIRATTGQKLRSALTFPIFMLSYIPIAIISIFRQVEWLPVPHGKMKKRSFR